MTFRGLLGFGVPICRARAEIEICRFLKRAMADGCYTVWMSLRAVFRLVDTPSVIFSEPGTLSPNQKLFLKVAVIVLSNTLRSFQTKKKDK